MLERSTSFAAMTLTLVLCAPVALGEEEEKKLVKSGSFEVENVRVSFMGSAAYSTGRLEYRGKSRKFKVVGLGIGGIGVSKTRAWGGVYNLKKLDELPVRVHVSSTTELETSLMIAPPSLSAWF